MVLISFFLSKRFLFTSTTVRSPTPPHGIAPMALPSPELNLTSLPEETPIRVVLKHRAESPI